MGKPHKMVTLTPKSGNQFVVAVRAGLGEAELETPEAIAQYFYDVTDGKMPMPSHGDIQGWTDKDPVRAAEYFTEMVNFYLREVIGWDKENGCSFPGGGLYGECIAYAGGIENQGSALLHTHLLFWFKNFARTIDVQNTIPGYNAGLAQYVDSLINTQLPIYALCATPTIAARASSEPSPSSDQESAVIPMVVDPLTITRHTSVHNTVSHARSLATAIEVDCEACQVTHACMSNTLIYFDYVYVYSCLCIYYT
jgi:hypothetical protein